MTWNLGGWLGGQLGGSAWMLVAGLLTIPKDALAAVIVIALFAAVNIVGFFLWSRRESLSPYAGIQILLPILGAVGLIAVYVLENAGVYESIQSGGRVSATNSYGILVIVVAALMLMFWFRFGRSSTRRSPGGDDESR